VAGFYSGLIAPFMQKDIMKIYLFIDELQEIEGFEKALRSLRFLA
jgi:predicted AAA+ superfamily ATPase